MLDTTRMHRGSSTSGLGLSLAPQCRPSSHGKRRFGSAS
jgi:hypothetical protein